jgi:GTPase SAR1 family protein
VFSTDIPPEVISKGWIDVFKFWRQGEFVDLRQCRVMVVGNKEVGKTSLIRALTNEITCLAPHIRERTQGIDVSIQRLDFSDSGLVCTLWDFAGQEIYYLSHSIHFSRRCIFCLVWSHVHTDISDQSRDLELEREILRPLFTWLQMLCHHVPNAQIILVGSHSKYETETFQKMNAVVERRVKKEIERLNTCLREEKDALHLILKTRLVEYRQCQTECAIKGLCEEFGDYSALLSFCQQLQFSNDSEDTELRKLQLCVLRYDEVRSRLCKICGRFDLSDPLESDEPSTMQIQSVLAVDSRDDADSVRQLRHTLNIVGMDMPFIKRESQVPKWYRDVLDFVHEEIIVNPGRNPTKKYKLGSAFITRHNVTAMVQAQLTKAAVPRLKSEEEIWECLSFWSDLGETFVCVCPCWFHGFRLSHTFTSGTR